MLISQPISRCLTNHSELCMLSRLLNNQPRRISIYRLQRRPSFGFESSVSSTPMTSGEPVRVPQLLEKVSVDHYLLAGRRRGRRLPAIVNKSRRLRMTTTVAVTTTSRSLQCTRDRATTMTARRRAPSFRARRRVTARIDFITASP